MFTLAEEQLAPGEEYHALVFSYDPNAPRDQALTLEGSRPIYSSPDNSSVIDAYLSAVDDQSLAENLKSYNATDSFPFLDPDSSRSPGSPSPSFFTASTDNSIPVPGQNATYTPSSFLRACAPEDRDDPSPTYVAHADVFASKKYKPVALRTKPLADDLPGKFRIVRDIKGDPLADLPKLPTHPPEYVPTGRYTPDRRAIIDDNHPGDFLWPEERKLMHWFMCAHESAFAWNDAERGKFREDFYPPVDFPVVPHTPWMLKNIPIPRQLR